MLLVQPAPPIHGHRRPAHQPQTVAVLQVLVVRSQALVLLEALVALALQIHTKVPGPMVDVLVARTTPSRRLNQIH